MHWQHRYTDPRNGIGSERRASILCRNILCLLNFKNSHLWQMAGHSLESELKHWGCLEEELECSCTFLRLNKQ